MISVELVKKQIEDIQKLRPGWCNGEGRVPCGEDYGIVSKILSDHLIPIPYIYPLVEGGLILEWFDFESYPTLEISYREGRLIWHVLEPEEYIEFTWSNLTIGSELREKMRSINNGQDSWD